MRTPLTLAFAALLALPAAAGAAPADLDRSYGGGTGKAYVTAGKDEFGVSMALQPDGRVVVLGGSGASDAVGSSQAAARFTAQGVPDTSFDRDGTALIVPSEKTSGLSRIIVRPNGRLVAVGSELNTNRDLRIYQLLPNGSPDTSFGPAGKSGRVVVDLGADEQGRAVTVRPDGRLVVAGQRATGGASNFLAVQLRNPQADPDPAYGGGSGWSNADMGSPSEAAEAVALGPGGSILLGGYAGSPDRDFALTRLRNPEGTFDPLFAPGQSRAFANFGGNNDVAQAMAIQPDGKVVLAGFTNAAGGLDFAIARFTQAGALDSGFGDAGKVRVEMGGLDRAEGIAVQPNGKIVVAGTSAGNFAILRLQPNGQRDSTFGNDGKAIVDMGDSSDQVGGVALQADGKIVVAGSGERNPELSGDFAALRLLGDSRAGGGGGVARKALRCAGRRATVIGTNRKDRLKGTRKADVIVALGGNDRVDGRGGNDLVCGGSGKDKLAGGAGKDKVYGQSGKDRASGGKGNDRLSGGAAADRLAGGSGKDRLKGDAGNDRLSGGRAKDRLFGGSGRDLLRGGGGRDVLRGGPGRDKQIQ